MARCLIIKSECGWDVAEFDDDDEGIMAAPRIDEEEEEVAGMLPCWWDEILTEAELLPPCVEAFESFFDLFPVFWDICFPVINMSVGNCVLEGIV